MESYYYQEVKGYDNYTRIFIIKGIDLPEFEWMLGQLGSFKSNRKDSILAVKQYKALDQEDAKNAWFNQENNYTYPNKRWEYFITDFVG